MYWGSSNISGQMAIYIKLVQVITPYELVSFAGLGHHRIKNIDDDGLSMITGRQIDQINTEALWQQGSIQKYSVIP
jgi:hypothetical protein